MSSPELDPDDFTYLGTFAGGQMWIRPAYFEQDHEAIENVAKQSKACNPFLGKRFSSAEGYEAHTVRVLVDREPDGVQRCVGFSCFEMKEDGEHAIFFLAVDEREQRKGCGRELFEDIREKGAPRRYTSTLPKTAEAGLAFSAALGFNENGRTARGGIRLRLEEW